MNDDTNHELLSAYLDGELPPAERERVERLLSESAELRQVYDELCAVRASLVALPRHRVGEDLSARVLRLAQEARLAQQAAAGQPEAEQSLLVPAEAARADERSRRWRAVLYPVLAVAAALAMLINSPEKKQPVQMARAPAGSAPKAEMSAPPDDSADKRGTTGLATSGPMRRDEDFDTVDADSASGYVKDAMPEGAEAGGSSDGSSVPLYQNKLKISAATKHFATASPSEVRGEQLPGEIRATLVLNCTLAPAALRDKAFEQLLARNHVTPLPRPLAQPQGSEATHLAEDQTTDRKDAISKSKKQAARSNIVQKSVAGTKDAESMSRDLNDGLPDGVLVEMDPNQFVAILADLQEHPEQFVSIQIPAKSHDSALRATGSLGPFSSTAKNDFYSNGGSLEAGAAPEKLDAAADSPAPPANNAPLIAGKMGEAGSGPPRLLVLFHLTEAGQK